MAPSRARQGLEDLASSVPPEVLDDARLLVSEIVTNAVTHADLRGDEHITLRIRPGPRSVEVIAQYPDHVGFPRPLPAQPPDTHGWGLFFLDRVADRWSVAEREGRTDVWFEVRQPDA
jgi:anti-sigma regulatory factor (Ser/Thr protein kinase)